MAKITSKWSLFLLVLTSLSSGCGIHDRIKNKASISQFVLTVYANDTCELEINGAKLTSLKREISSVAASRSERIVMNICSPEDTRLNQIYISSMYPGSINPPLAFANTKSIAARYEGTKSLYFVDTQTFPITDRWRGHYAIIDQDEAIDVFGEIQFSVLSPDWESLNYSPQHAIGWAINGYELRAVQGKATFYGVADVEKYNILYKLVGTAMRWSCC